MFLLTSLGSNSCLTIHIITKSTSNAIASFISPFIALIVDHGIITVPVPSIGSASTNPINNATSSG